MPDFDFDLLVIGEINPDLIVRDAEVTPIFGQTEKLVDDTLLTIGSSSVIMACGAARLGLKVAFIGMVGDDLFGRFMLRAMAERGIDTHACHVHPTIATGISIILSSGNDRAILTYPGTIPELQASHIDMSLVPRCRHLHVGGYFLLDKLRPTLPELFAYAHEQGLTTSLDTNWDPHDRWDVADLLPHCDVFLPNEAEVKRIAQTECANDGLLRLALKIETIAVKRGRKGGLVMCGEIFFEVPPIPVEVVDTTGAGDSFDAGFVYGYLQGWPLERSLKLAVACGSLSTLAAGGTGAQPTLPEAMAAAGLSPSL